MKFMHTSQKYRPQTALLGASGLLKQAEWIAKAGLGLREIAKCAFKFSPLTVLLWFFAFILTDFNRPRAECAPIMRYCALKEL